MIIWYLASLFVFILLIAYENKKHRKIMKKKEFSFWEKERLANNTRRKSLDDLAYIAIPFERLPMHLHMDDPQIRDCHQILSDLKDLNIVNLTGISNTDLKLQYGTANISRLAEYDQSYTLLVRTLQKWADCLLAKGCEAEALTILEFAFSTGTDVSRTYFVLADIYRSHGETEKISLLIEKARSLNSILSSSIVRTLQESGLCNG